MERLSGRNLTARLVLGLLALAPGALSAEPKKAEEPPEEWAEHVHPSGAFTFRAPVGWKLETLPGRKEVLQLSGAEGLVRFFFLRSEAGFDSLHVSCMSEFLAGGMESLRGSYEYDFRGAPFGGRPSLDSAFVVTYDRPMLGEQQWRQRNLTVVGGGQSLCIVAHCPLKVWKKSKEARRTLDGIVQSVRFRPQP
jgi:hypothetical protein